MSKTVNSLKTKTTIVLSIIVLSVFGYAALKRNKPTQNDNPISTNTVIIPVNQTLRDSLVSFGMGLLGTPYAEASCSIDGFDCSGFVFYVFDHFKIKVPRSSSEFKNFGTEVQIENVKKGDILVFLSPTRNAIGHVGIVTNPKGMESDFIHATSGRDMKVVITSLKKEGYTKRFVKAVDAISAKHNN